MPRAAAPPPAVAETALARSPLDPLPQAFLDHLAHERRLAPRTLAMYHDALVRLQRQAAEAERALTDIQPYQVRRWAAQLHASGLGSRSIAIHLAAWRGLFRHLGRLGQVKLNPVEGVRAPKAPRPLPKALSVEQAVALAEPSATGAATESTRHGPALAARDHAIVELLYGCGLRVAELTGLDVVASDHAAGWLDLQASDAHVLGKGSKRRSVPMGAAAIAAVQQWLTQRASLAAADEPALFVSQRGTRLSPGQLRLRLAAQAQAAGVPSKVHPHMLRHSYASHLLQSSGDLRAVQELLGHANIATTQVYTKLDFQHLAKVYDAAHPRAKKR
ncbi:MAG: tyrosine recombinase XerC [Burkholderiales bacterium]